jgi:Fuc2NAc and GlcNAc transferase
LTAVTLPLVATAAATALACWLLTRLLITVAPRLGLEDVPNHRSSHDQVTARGGGLAIVVATLLGMVATVAMTGIGPGAGRPPVSWWLAAAACPLLALVGLIDDIRALGYRLRLFAQALAIAVIVWAGATELPGLAAALAAMPPAALAAMPSVAWPRWLIWLAAAAVVVSGVWWVNLFNFMDGIDGLATMEALFLLGCFLLLERLSFAGDEALGWYALLLTSAAVGFLPHNWPPARIFLGDCGSLFLGVSVFILAMHSVTRGHTGPWFWLIVTGAFVSDASVTLLRRLLSGVDVTSAHRSHLYQRLGRRWGDHRKVTLVYSATNLAWFLPLALISHQWPRCGLGLTIAAYAPAIAICWCLGAGRPGDPVPGSAGRDDSDSDPDPVTTQQT